MSSAPAPRVIQLEDGTYVEIREGLQPGFAHCCGDDEHSLEIKCSEGLMRCYESMDGEWKQTYGKYCKSSLDSQCYDATCPRVCEAYWELGPTRWQTIIP